MPRLLIVQAPYYEEIADALYKGAVAALEAHNCQWHEVKVPGALEIPAAIRIHHLGGTAYDGYVALGCVIRGETSHYDIVAGQSAAGLMTLACEYGLAIGNGILTCDTQEQARARALPDKGNKGGDAVRAALALIALRAKHAP